MFTRESVLESLDPAEATASYWAWRLSRPKRLYPDLGSHSNVQPPRGDTLGPAIANDSERENTANFLIQMYGATSVEVTKLAIYQALFADLRLGLVQKAMDPEDFLGIEYGVDYAPVGRMASVLAGIETYGLPSKTQTCTFSDCAFVEEKGYPLTVIYGDISLVRAQIAEIDESAETQEMISLEASPPPIE